MPLALTLPMLVLGLPEPSAAQAPAPADLIGSWALPDSSKFGFTFRADSTMHYVSPTTTATARWRLAGDTLVLDRQVVKVKGVPPYAIAKLAPRRLALQQQQLVVTIIDTLVNPGRRSTVYQRVDSLTGSPGSTTPSKP